MTLILSGTDGLSDVDGTAATPAIRGTDANTGIFFGTDIIGFSEGGAEAMRITSAGNVGIADTAPNYKFNVGAAAGVTSLDGVGISLFTSGSLTSNIGGVLNFRPGLGQTASDIFNLSICAYDHNGDTNADGLSINGADGVSFSTGGNARSERMRIDSSGIMLIGATSARTTEAKLELRSAANTALSLYMFKDTQVEATLGFKSSNDSNFYVGSGSTSVGTNGVFLTNTGNSWSSISDERMKTIVEPIANAAEKVSSLRTVIGYFNNDELQTRRPFLIAQDVQAVLPEAVSIQNTEMGTLGMSYTDTIPLLVAAIKEQQALITALTTRITALEAAAA